MHLKEKRCPCRATSLSKCPTFKLVLFIKPTFSEIHFKLLVIITWIGKNQTLFIFPFNTTIMIKLYIPNDSYSSEIFTSHTLTAIGIKWSLIFPTPNFSPLNNPLSFSFSISTSTNSVLSKKSIFLLSMEAILWHRAFTLNHIHSTNCCVSRVRECWKNKRNYKY